MAKVALKLVGREELEFTVEVNADGVIQKSELKGVGNREFLVHLADYRKKIKGKLKDLALPEGHSTAELMIAEAILKVRNEWNPVYKEEEICHCRNVPLAVVDKAIVCGAHTAEKVSAWTSASTACGTCRPDVQAHLRFRLRSGN